MQLDELNNQINEYIYELKTREPELAWDTVADITNDWFNAYEIALTGNACRKRFKRFTENRATKTPVIPENAPELVTVTVNDESDVVSQLRQQFGISDEYVARKIKTTATDDKTWAGAEWVRETVSEDKLQAVIEFIENHQPNYLEFDRNRWPNVTAVLPQAPFTLVHSRLLRSVDCNRF